MLTLRTVLTIGCVGLLAACSSGPAEVSADIAKVGEVRSSFGPEFQVKVVPRTGIDPKLLAGTALPPGLNFDPADCSKFAVGQQLPQGVQGNMSAVAAEGKGGRFITIALETSEPVPVTEPGRTCRRIGFSGAQMRGLIETIDAPHIDGVTTLGVHRVIEAVTGGKSRVGELYNYSAYFGPYQVIVTANPLVVPSKPVVPVDTARARELLVSAVAAIRN
ncbi:hypothetical protein BST33_10560 [Mycolicibacter minnesotensis]|uniref:Uncharacterized protein n=1 Tax=Mycolicibacter minnesotensis TaxID=1118379 RepID=A0A7I7R822_9MYCO|nr:DUF5642 family protein [Mycolicibacter minnesotensis]ORB00767.1 hypothetical protein BST33_10560 [Mycolicibacter minnesotensis]BBY34532.1 hypothetical protein MMIN_25930 [Mycolicibacter minnesotensis]